MKFMIYRKGIFMRKRFNVTGTCIPEKHYMVKSKAKIQEIVDHYIKDGKYFTIHRARQYGKTTLLYMLEKELKDDYIVIRLSFEAADEIFISLYTLAMGLIRRIGRKLKAQTISDKMITEWNQPISKEFPLEDLGDKITLLCENCGKRIVLMIDEVDKNSDNQIFLSFLGLLRSKYLEQMQGEDTTFWSVILAGVYDIKNLKLKLHPEQESKYNSPWNIAADFDMDLSFSQDDIKRMLDEYRKDRQIMMDLSYISGRIHQYTGGYPYLVSRICLLLDEKIPYEKEFSNPSDAWTEKGLQRAIQELLRENNTLFDDMVKKLEEFPGLKKILQTILFDGTDYLYNPDNYVMNIGTMFGFLKDQNGRLAIANRIFEMRLYNLFLSEMQIGSAISQAAVLDRNQFICEGKLNMELVLEKFQEHFSEIYGDYDETFLEEQGRRLFLMYIRPIINGTGNYYCEAQTRTRKRTDLIIDYRGEQIIVEMKIWRGEEYQKRGEQQLFEYLEEYKVKKGYLLSFNFNKKKCTGIQKIQSGDKVIMEVVV